MSNDLARVRECLRGHSAAMMSEDPGFDLDSDQDLITDPGEVVDPVELAAILLLDSIWATSAGPMSGPEPLQIDRDSSSNLDA